MIKERFMVTGRQIANGETVEGYYGVDLDGNVVIDTCDKDVGILGLVHVDINTVEPVAVKVHKERCGQSFGKPTYCGGCPNCGQTVASAKNHPYELRANDYCGRCGQRLDWSEEA